MSVLTINRRDKLMNKVLTISVAAYNAEKFLKQCLESFIIEEIINKIEVLIIDDGSSDNTYSIGKQYEDKYPNTFKVIRKKNGGHGSTINEGISNANGKYFKIVDADDWVEKKGIIRLVNELSEIEVDMVLNDYYTVDEETRKKTLIKLIKSDNLSLNKVLNIEKIYKDIKLEMHGVVIRTSILKSMGRKITENCFYVDVEYILFPMININTILLLNFPVYDYRKGLNEQSTNFVNRQKRRDQHEKVCLRLVDYYTEVQDSLSREKAKLIKNRIILMALSQYRIYCSMQGNKDLLNEIRRFDSSIRERNLVLYNEILTEGKVLGEKKLSIFVNLLRKTNFNLYLPLMKILN